MGNFNKVIEIIAIAFIAIAFAVTFYNYLCTATEYYEECDELDRKEVIDYIHSLDEE